MKKTLRLIGYFVYIRRERQQSRDETLERNLITTNLPKKNDLRSRLRNFIIPEDA